MVDDGSSVPTSTSAQSLSFLFPPQGTHRDIPLLVSYFTEHYATRMGKQITTIPSGTMEHLVRYSWPGNIRELQNLIERAVIMSPGPVLNVPLEVLRTSEQLDLSSTGTLEQAERQHILRTLEETNWVYQATRCLAKLG
jgi:formate hydrogenlyase transcriptional activator